MINRALKFIISFSLLFPASYVAKAEKIYPANPTSLQMDRVEVRRYNDGSRKYLFVATDTRDNKTYGSYVVVNGSNWVSSRPYEFGLAASPDLGGHHFQKIGPASPEMTKQFNQSLNHSLNQFENFKQNKKTILIDNPAPGAAPTTSGAVSSTPGLNLSPGKTESSGMRFPVNPGGDSRSSYERDRAAMTPYRVGETLEQMGWDMRSHENLQEIENRIIQKEQGAVDQDIKKQIEAVGVQNSSIKAQMILDLNHYLRAIDTGATQASGQANLPPDNGVLTELDLTPEGAQKLRTNAKEQLQNKDWRSLAATITELANPWTPQPDILHELGVTDKNGTLIGPALKAGALNYSGRNEVQHHQREIANRLQAEALADPSWKTSPFLAQKFVIAGLALGASVTLEGIGAEEEAVALLKTAEATVDFLTGVGTGIGVGVNETIDGVKSLVVAGDKLATYTKEHPLEAGSKILWTMGEIGNLFLNPQAQQDLAEAVAATVWKHAPVIAATGWNYILTKGIKGSAQDRGEIAGRIVFEVTAAVAGAEMLKAGQGALAVFKTGARTEVALAQMAKVLAPIDRAATLSAEVAAQARTTGKFTRALPDLHELALMERKAGVSEIIDTNGKMSSYYLAFDTPIQQVKLLPGDVLYQAQNLGQKHPGAFFGGLAPVDRVEAEAFFNIAKYGKYGDQVGIYVVSEPVTVYFGGTTGGEARQFFFSTARDFKDGIDLNDVLKKAGEIKLPYKKR